MKQRRTHTLMFQLVLSYIVILVMVLGLIVFSWRITRSEARNAMKMTALTSPYTRILTGLNRLRSSKSGILGTAGEPEEAAESAAILEDLEQAADELAALLNDGGYSRSSVDIGNTLTQYREIYEGILDSYARQDYGLVNQGILRLNQVEGWLHRYLSTLGADISARQEEIRARSGRSRGVYYRIMLSIGCAIFLFAAAVLIVSAHRFVAPIELLCRNVRAFRLSDDPEALKAQGIPCKKGSVQEVRTLATAIYSMQSTVLDQYKVEKQNDHLREKLDAEALHVARIEKQLQQTKLKALQAQINPHFLFNTLNMIGQMAYIENAEHTVQLLETFSAYFRYNVDSFERSVTLAEELENVRGYIALQRERFGDRIRYTVEADEAVRCIEVPSLIIQPLVENALAHGLRMRTDGGEVDVSVTAVTGGGFAILVRDNGKGMREEALNKLVEQLREPDPDEYGDHPSIGLNNVISRLRLTFGQKLKVSLKSRPEEGFMIQLLVEGEAAL